jgi:hypothetical protein
MRSRELRLGGEVRWQNLIHVRKEQTQHLGRKDRDAVDIATPRPGQIVKKDFNVVDAGLAQGILKLNTGV